LEIFYNKPQFLYIQIFNQIKLIFKSKIKAATGKYSAYNHITSNMSHHYTHFA